MLLKITSNRGAIGGIGGLQQQQQQQQTGTTAVVASAAQHVPVVTGAATITDLTGYG